MGVGMTVGKTGTGRTVKANRGKPSVIVLEQLTEIGSQVSSLKNFVPKQD